MNKENNPGVKHDQGKPKFSLMPPLAEMEVVKVLSFGAEKYSPDNWREVEPRRYVDAAGRHINAHRRGEQADDESELHHLAHAICCLMFQLEKVLESEQVNMAQSRKVTPRRRRVTAIRKKRKSAPQEQHPAPVGTFSTNDLPMIGQAYHFRSNAGVVYERHWQSSPQEWKRLIAGQVFKTSKACIDAEDTGTYIFHEDDPADYPEFGRLLWYVRPSPVSLTWLPMSILPNDEKTLEIAKDIHSRGDAAASKEQADAKAFWRNVSMQRHGTPYGPLHPDAKQYVEPFPGNDDGEEHG